MPALPAESDFTGAARTNAEMKVTHAALRAYLAGLLGADGAASTALAALGALVQSGNRVRTSATTVLLEDRGKVITAESGTWALTLPSLAATGPNWTILARNVGAGTITITPDGSDLIDTASSATLPPGAAILLSSSAARWRGTVLAADMALGRLLRAGELQTSATDATTGRLLRLNASTGAFGLGGTYAPQLADLDAVSIPAGLYFFNTASGTTGTNPGFTFGAVAVIQSIGSGVQAPLMIAIERSATLGRMAWRTSLGGVWGSWQVAFGRRNAVGTVSQASGVPTGAIVERGTNANGSFTRWLDGSQECFHTLTASAGAGVAWTFPAAFSAAPVIGGNAVATVLSGVCPDAAPSTTAVTLSARGADNARRADVMHLRARGFWF